jgi:hypothetical protein
MPHFVLSNGDTVAISEPDSFTYSGCFMYRLKRKVISSRRLSDSGFKLATATNCSSYNYVSATGTARTSA